MTGVSSGLLRGRRAIVTGASSGLGLRFATVLAEAGATVYAAARRLDRLEALAAMHPGVRAVECDVSKPADRQRLVAAAADAGSIDVLVNNAGIGGFLRIEDEPADLVERVLGVNLVAAFDLCRLAGEAMSQDGGSIVNVTSIQAIVAGHPLGGAAYAASKGALISLTRELAAQWGPRNIRVNGLAPGWFQTEMTEELFADEAASRFVSRNTMLSRPGRVDELDGAMLLLVSPAGSYITGQVLVVDGGWTAR